MKSDLTGQYTLDNLNADYQAFTSKFEQKKTTDDCYTPAAVYAAVADYVATRYGIERDRMVRPFWPGADYKLYDYPPDCVVVDNPPFSILSEIVRTFNAHGVRYFLFAPALTLFSYMGETTACIAVGAEVTYENGAKVNTSFVTNLEPGTLARSDPELYEALGKVRLDKPKKSNPQYVYPPELCTAAMLNSLSKHGEALVIHKGSAVKVGNLDSMRKARKKIFGGGLMLSPKAAAEKAAAEKAAAEKTAAEKAAAEKAAAEKAAATVWELSEEEEEFVRLLEKA